MNSRVLEDLLLKLDIHIVLPNVSKIKNKTLNLKMIPKLLYKHRNIL